MERDATSLTIACALTLISEKVRFWSDEQRDLHGNTVEPRCMNMTPEVAENLRQSLIAIADHCKSGLQAYDKATGRA